MRSVRLVTGSVIAVTLGLIPATAPAQADVHDITILGINDFHGRLLPNDSSREAGASVMVGKIKALEAGNPNTVFAAAGDLIGASTFESFVQQDKPTIDVFNEAGLDVSAAGNHEFDQGYNDLVNRVLAPYDPTTNPYGGAAWQYLAANVRKASDNSHALPDRWITDLGGVKVGFVGAVTEELPTLVNPAGISQLKVTSIVNEVNTSADALEAEGADVVVLLIHEGAQTTDIPSATDDSAFGRIVKGVDGSVDAIISGHTHLAYNHRIPVPEWQAQNRPVTTRPVVSAGQYGMNLNKLDLSVDLDPDKNPATDDSQITSITTEIVPLYKSAPADSTTQAIVDAAVAQADTLGAKKLGTLRNAFVRAQLSTKAENRGGESTLGNLAAEVYRWATGAQIGFINPGGLRQDLFGNNSGGYPADLTYKQAAVVQPFANTLVTMKLTGAQIKTLLEQQWQRTDKGEIPTRPFLRLGTSQGFKYTYDATRTEGDRITAIWLNGKRIAPGDVLSVATNAFLAAGGDNFRMFGQGSDKRDSGQVDLQATVAYAAAQSPLGADWTQHAIGLSGASDGLEYGQRLRLNVSSWTFSGPDDLRDSQVEVRVGDTVVGSFPVDNTLGTAPFDDYGTATIDAEIPSTVNPGVRQVILAGDRTGTTVALPLTVSKRTATLNATATPSTIRYRGRTSVAVSVKTSGAPATGTVVARRGTQVVGAGELVEGTARLDLRALDQVGAVGLELRYGGDDITKAATGTVTVKVTKATPKVRVLGPKNVGHRVTRMVTVRGGASFTVTGRVRAKVLGGRKVTDRSALRAGVARLDLGRLPAGTYRVRYTYLGSDVAKKRSVTKVLRVRR